MRARYFASITSGEDLPKVGHFLGLPAELTGGKDLRVRLPRARILLIQQGEDAGVFLYRYSEDGSFSGDTWHASLEDAREQVAFEYGDAVGEWKNVPEEVDNPVAFALAQISQ